MNNEYFLPKFLKFNLQGNIMTKATSGNNGDTVKHKETGKKAIILNNEIQDNDCIKVRV